MLNQYIITTSYRHKDNSVVIGEGWKTVEKVEEVEVIGASIARLTNDFMEYFYGVCLSSRSAHRYQPRRRPSSQRNIELTFEIDMQRGPATGAL